MSVESLAIALHHSKATGVARLVIIGIANHDGDGGAWPSVNTLAKYAGGVNRRTVQRAIEQLEDAGEIERKIMAGGTRDMADHMRPNLYEFTLVCPPDCDRTKNHRTIEQPVDNQPAPRGLETTPRSGDRPPRGLETAPPAVCAPPEPSLNHPENHQSPFVSTSPASGSICWSCGNEHATTARYCLSCTNNGMDSPWVPCTGCSAVRKRNRPGQQSFTCKDCKP